MQRTIVLIGGLLLAAAAAHAQPNGKVYVVGAGGVSSYNDDCSGVPQCDTSGAAAKIIGGFAYTDMVAFELTAFSFGQESASDGFTSVAVKMGALGAGVALHAPLGPGFTGVLRLGLAAVDVKGSGSGGGVLLSASESSTQGYAGLGLSYKISDQFFIEAALDATRGTLRGSSTPVSAFTLGLGLRF